MSNKAEAALKYSVKLGWHVFPCWNVENGKCACRKPDCRNPGKHPVGRLVRNGLKKASTTASIIESWWKKEPSANIGVRTGPESRLWVLDLDGPEGIEALEHLRDGGHELPKTVTARTGGGGKHHYFAWPEGVEIKNQQKINGLPIDVRGKDGYVIAPPSDHVLGGQYEWVVAPWDCEVAAAPPWLLDLVLSKGAAKAKPQKGLSFMFDGECDLATHPGAKQGERNDTLCRLVGKELAAHRPIPELLGLARAWGGRCSPPLPPEEVERTVRSLAAKHAEGGSSQGTNGKSSVILRRFDRIAPEKVEWLWPNRIALGKLSLVVGVPGLGKTFVALDIAACVSTGQRFGDGAACQRGEVIFASLEDGPEDTLRPRLDSLGADPSKVHFLDGVATSDDNDNMRGLRLDLDVEALDAALTENPDVRLLIVDPISAALGNTDSHKDAEVRGVLRALKGLAEKHNVAIVGIAHFNKATSQQAIHRTMGSVGFVAAARTVWAIVEDPADNSRRLLLPLKNNLANAAGLAFRISNGEVCYAQEPVHVSVNELLAEQVRRPRQMAKDLLRQELKQGPVPAKEIHQMAKAAGIAPRTLNRAKKEMEVRSVKEGGQSHWQLPQSAEKPEQQWGSPEAEAKVGGKEQAKPEAHAAAEDEEEEDASYSF